MDVDAAARGKNLRAKRRRAAGPENRALDVSEAPILRADQVPPSSPYQRAPCRRCAVPSTGDGTKVAQVVFWSRLGPFERPPRKDRMDSRR